MLGRLFGKLMWVGKATSALVGLLVIFVGNRGGQQRPLPRRRGRQALSPRPQQPGGGREHHDWQPGRGSR